MARPVLLSQRSSRRHRQQPRARFAPRSSPRFAASTVRARCARRRRYVFGVPRHRPMHMRFAKCIGHRADFRALLLTRVPLVTALLRSPPPPRPSLPRAVPAPPPPLNRRGGSDPPASPASIFRSFIQHESTIRPAGPALGSTPDAAGCWACHRALCPAFSVPFEVKQGPAIVGSSVCSGAYGPILLK